MTPPTGFVETILFRTRPKKNPPSAPICRSWVEVWSDTRPTRDMPETRLPCLPVGRGGPEACSQKTTWTGRQVLAYLWVPSCFLILLAMWIVKSVSALSGIFQAAQPRPSRDFCPLEEALQSTRVAKVRA